jgi:hypothetical protein
MKQSLLTRYVVAIFMVLMVTSCTKEGSSRQQETTEGFRALVMGGKDIDPNQTWSTATNTSVSVTVNLKDGEQYTVFIYHTHPATSTSTPYLGMATMTTGETKTISVAPPANVNQLYAACYDSQKQVMCMPVVNGQVTFSGTITSSTGIPSISTGNRWSVPYKALPDLSKYTTDSLTEVSDLDPELPEDAEARLKISDPYTGFIPFLSTHTNMSVYVTSTWTLTFDQRINSGNVIVVGQGGEIVVPKDFKLTTTPSGESSVMGRIYVMPGGKISGEGTVEFSNEGDDYNYNAGTISAGEVAIVSGSFYNGGYLGNNNQNTKLTGPNDNSTSSEFINLGTAYLNSADGTSIVIMNAGSIGIMNNLTMTQPCRMDDNSSMSCGSLTLQGDGKSVLYMGNGAYVNCRGNISVSNYGVWGPSGDNYKTNARFRVGGCTQYSAASGNANEYMLDHVQFEVPIGTTNLDLLGGWMNGSQTSIEESRQTCFYLIEGTPELSKSNYLFYAFEIPDNYNVCDYDYNDVVLRVSTPYDNGDGTYTVSVSVAAVGSNQQINIIYNGEDFGKEVHEVMGISTSSTINNNSVTSNPEILDMITISDPNFAINKLSFSLRKTNNAGTSTTLTQSSSSEDAPLYLVVNGNSAGKWLWPKEGSNIALAYKNFSTWANNAQTALDWYDSKYASSTRIISW